MSNAIVRLLLNTYDFDKNLSKAKGDIGGFEKSISSMASSAGAGLTKLAGVFGVAMTAGEAFNKTLNSSQRLGDMTASTIQAAKDSVNQFFYALGNGEFTSFLSGLDAIIAKSKAAYAAMDQLGNTQISHGYFSAKNEAAIQEAQYTAKNKFAPLEDRMSAFADWREALEEQARINNTLRGDLVTAITTAVKNEVGRSNVSLSLEDVEMALKLDVMNPAKRDELKSQYSSQYEEYRRLREEAVRRAPRVDSNSRYSAEFSKQYGEYKRTIDELDKKYREAIIVNAMLNKYSDEELQNIANMMMQYQQLSGSLNSISREYNETAMEFNNANKAVQGFTAVASLEGIKVYPQGGTTSGGGGGTTGKLKADPLGVVAWDAEGWANMEAKGMLNKLRVAIESGDKIPIKELPIVIEDEAIEETLPTFVSEEDRAKKYADTLVTVADAFGMINNAASSMNNSTLSFITGSFAQIAQMIVQLNALTTAQGVASAAKLPFPLNLAAMAAVVSTVAGIFGSLPKFADGGIVGGSSFFGDRQIARVNSGEMILNQTQQGRLFRMLDGGASGRMAVDGEARVQGKTMYIAIRNYMKSSGVNW